MASKRRGGEAKGEDDGPPRLRLDDLRRLGSALLAASGLAPDRAAAMASHLLWFDAASTPRFGIATLPDWLDRIARGEVDPHAQPRIGPERAGTATLDGRRGVGPLVLSRAAELAAEKARDVGVGLVRVAGLGPSGPAAPVAAELATLGPEAAVVIGPGPSWAWALPTAEGLPAVADSSLAARGEAPPPPAALIAPAWALAPEGGWLVLAVSVIAAESLTALHGRIGLTLRGRAGTPGLLLPGPWDARRREARERGLDLDGGLRLELRRRAEAAGVGMARLLDPA